MESLEDWYARRRPIGTRRAVRADGAQRAAHLDPAAPRVIEEWTGYAWVPVATTDDYAAACRVLHQIEGDGVMREMMPHPETTGLRNPLAAGKGRHRRTA